MSDLGPGLKRGASRAVAALPASPRRILERGGAWLSRTAAEPRDEAPAPPPVAPAAPRYPTQRPLPLPDGVEEAALRGVFSTWSIDGEPEGHMEGYVADSFWRFVHTFGLARGLSGRCLELGANPYFTTHLFDRYTDLDLELANYFGNDDERAVQTVRYRDTDGNVTERVFDTVLFNIEEEPFPFPDGSLDVVVFCEIIEHLLMDPIAVLNEIRRVLTDDGWIILTTPNVCRLRNAVTIVHGDNIYDPYSGYGPYGRHNREYTMRELQFLMDFLGFEVEESFTADGHPDPVEHMPRYAAVAPLLADRGDDLGQYLFLRARKVRPAREGLPTNLYRSYPPDALVDP